MTFLYIVLVLCTIAVVGTAIALYLRVRAHMSKSADAREGLDGEDVDHNHDATS